MSPSDHQQVEDNASMQSYLERVVHFEQMLLEKSSALFAARGEGFDEIVNETLYLIGSHLAVDRAYVIKLNNADLTMGISHEWCAHNVIPWIDTLQNLRQDDYPCWMAQIRQGEEILIPDVSALPPIWAAEKAVLEKKGICSMLALPMRADDKLFGFLAFDSIRFGKTWGNEEQNILRFFANNIAVGWSSEINRQDLVQAMQVASQMARKAEIASQEKSSFLSNMSHEIRTPMNAVIGVSHLLMNTDLTTMQRRYVEIIHTSGQSILNIINSILDLSKIESGKFELEHVHFSLEEVFGDLDNIFHFQVADKGLQADYSIDPRIPTFLIGDPTRLQQILTNLVSNAVKYSNRGKISLHGVLKEIRDEQCWLSFTISDQGIGISPVEISRLFDPFWQAGVATRQSHQGSGLGLAICKNLSELMGGSIEVHSEVGVGSQFVVTLPFRVAKTGGKPKPNLPLNTSDHVLILDDDLVNQRFLAKLFHAWSIKTSTCTSFKGAANLIAAPASKRNPFTLCIIGHQHISGDGLKQARQLRIKAPSIRRLFLVTEPDNPMILEQERWAGIIDGFLSKPVKASVLSDELMMLLGRQEDALNLVKPVSTRYRFANARLLVAEDIAINREIIRALLANYGIEADLARDGIMAIDMVEQNNYDLVLMDVQMPLMDGLEATRQIRAMTDPARSRLPILALTAHALKEDRQACYDAGMNGHIIKPIDPDNLYDSLVKWLPDKLSREPVLKQQSPIPGQSMKEEPKNSLFSPQSGLELVGGNQMIYRSLLRNFIDMYADLPDQIEQLIQQNSPTGLTRLCHNLKSTTGHAGSAALSERSSELEKSIKASEWPLPGNLAQQIKIYGRDVIKLLHEISKYLESLESAETTETTESTESRGQKTVQPNRDNEYLASLPQLRDLKVHLSEHDPIGSRQILNTLLAVNWPEQLADNLRKIDRLLNQYQFEQALIQIDQMDKLIQI